MRLPEAQNAADRDAGGVEAPPNERLMIIGTAASGVAGAAAAVFAALCCVGPSAVALLGAGGAVAAAGLKPYRPLLLLVSLALIAFGFWHAYGRRVIADGRSCPVRVGRLARMMLWIAAAVWLASAVLPTS